MFSGRHTHGLSRPIVQKKFRADCSLPSIQRPYWRALSRANMPSVKEPAGLCRSGVGKRPDGLTNRVETRNKCVTWDVALAVTAAALLS